MVKVILAEYISVLPLDIRMLGEIQGLANCKIWTLDQAVS